MATSDKELEQQLKEAGHRLVDPPSSVDELLPLLDKVENLLSTMEQSPPLPMKNAMSVAQEALVADKLLKHSDADVRVAAASCVTEILRIAAPDAPYDDDIMKKVFQLIVSTFENLDDRSSRSYAKRVMILDTSAKVQSCAVMLDLECDALIIEMFKTFVRIIRDYHPEIVFSSMVAIMTLVFEESEEISPEMLSPILACLRQDNGGALPIAQRLAEKAFRTFSSKAKTNLKRAIEAMGISLIDYSDAVASIFREKSGEEEQNQVAVNVNVNQVDEVITAELAAEEVDMPNGMSPKSDISHDVTQGKDESFVELGFTKKEENAGSINLPKNMDGSSNADPHSQGLEHREYANTSLVTRNKEAELVVASENGKEQHHAERPIKDARQSVDDVSGDASRPPDSEAKTATLGGVAKKESNLATDSEEKPPKRLRKKVDKHDYFVDGSLRLTKKKMVEAKASPGKDSSDASAKDDEKKTITTPNLSSKATEDEHGSEATPKTNSKRKRLPAREKASDASERGEENLINSRIKVWWPLDHKFYEGVVSSYDSDNRKHLVIYDDGDQEILNLEREKWEFIRSDAKSAENEAAGERIPDASSKMPEKERKLKAKTSGKPAKQGNQTDSSAESKSKAVGNKTVEKLKEEKKEGKSGEINTPATENLSKGKERSGGIGGKMVAVASRLTAKSKAYETSLEGDFNGSRSSGKSKKETPKSSKSGQKTPKANKTSLEGDVNGGSKSSTKSKEGTPKSSKSGQKCTKQESHKATGKNKPKAKNTHNGDENEEETTLLNLMRKLREASSNAKASERRQSGMKRKR